MRSWPRGVAVLVLLVATLVLATCGNAAQQFTRDSAARPVGPSKSPTVVGNRFSTGQAGSVPHSVMELAVSKDGVAVSGSSWEEYNHDARLFAPKTGRVLGPFTPTRDTGGIYGVAIDRKHVYAISAMSVYRFSRSEWMAPHNIGSFDDGSQTSVRPLAVDSGGRGWLMGIAECDHRLYVSDPGDGAGLRNNGEVSPGSAQIKVIPLNLSGVAAKWDVPRARSIACDRQGNVWVLQQGVAGGPGPAVKRFTPSGHLLTSFKLPGYPTGLAADPRHNSIVVPDNGRDQNFKRFDYHGHLIATIGVKHGYLAGPTPGVVTPGRFVGPRAVAIDGSGNIYTAESGLPGAGQQVWTNMGSMAIITKWKPDEHTVAWRDYGLEFAGVGEQSSDGARFYDRHWEYRLERGKYQPYAYTVDPFAYPSDDRVGRDGDYYGAATRVLDLRGHRYLTMTSTPQHDFEIYVMRGEIAQPVVWFDANAAISTNGKTVSVKSNHRLPNNNGAEDYWMDSSGNVWSVGGLNGGRHGIWRYKLRGFRHDGTPRFDFRHVATYRYPPQISQLAKRIEVFDNTVYVSGFSSSDPDPGNDWDGWKSVGRHLLKFDSLPTETGWGAPVWEHDFSYGAGTHEMPYPTSFAADPRAGHVAVSWLYDPGTDQGRIDVLADSNGSTETTLSPPVPSLGRVGWLDLQRSLEARNGWLWAEDDWQSKTYGICLSNRCS